MAGDPSAFQAWLIAVPTVMTAVSTWYLNRKTVKNNEKSNTATKQVIESNASGLNDQITELQERVSHMEDLVKRTRDCQLTLAQKYTDSINALNEELKGARVAMARISPAPSKDPDPAQPQQPISPATTAPDLGKVIVKEDPKKPFGKVTIKP